MSTIINGNIIKKELLDAIQQEVLRLPFSPVFCDILVGTDVVSESYVKMKSRLAESVGIKFREAKFNASVSTEELIQEIENLNRVPHMCGIIVQLPLPAHINKQEVLDAIAPELDVDCLGSVNSHKFYSTPSLRDTPQEGNLWYPTALACMKALDSTGVDLSGKSIVVLGQGMLVGKPVSHLLEARGLTVTKVTRQTEHKEQIIKNADVIISAIGSGNFIKGDMVQEGVIIIDAGTSEEDGGVIGDVDFASVQNIASFISPTPGGVGPITVACLLKNVLEVAKGKM